ncbi:MAG: hypothetical protein HRU76_12820 [Phycisphaeraceae bacterium]|nr:hypothetical protein [Phycisphaerales bacterium]QOJ18414.1 MAG: hypothetical protein HRU76_12820 [Phycisphaeraceae bacterium]
MLFKISRILEQFARIPGLSFLSRYSNQAVKHYSMIRDRKDRMEEIRDDVKAAGKSVGVGGSGGGAREARRVNRTASASGGEGGWGAPPAGAPPRGSVGRTSPSAPPPNVGRAPSGDKPISMMTDAERAARRANRRKAGE